MGRMGHPDVATAAQGAGRSNNSGDLQIMPNNNGSKSRINPQKMISTLIFLVYCVVAILAGYHTYNVFALADPPFFALLGAIAVDGMLALTLYLIGTWYGDQRLVGFIGVVLFAALSGGMQIIARKIAMGEALDPVLQFCADYAVPISVTLSLLVLGTIKYFDQDSNGVPDFMERGNKNQGGNRGNSNQGMPPYQEVPSSQHNQLGNSNPGYGGGPALNAPMRPSIPQPSSNGNGNDKLNLLRGMQGQGGVGGNGKVRSFPNDLEPMPRLVDPRNPTSPD